MPSDRGRFYWVRTEGGKVYCDGRQPWGMRTRAEVKRVCEFDRRVDTYYTVLVQGRRMKVLFTDVQEAYSYTEIVVALQGDDK